MFNLTLPPNASPEFREAFTRIKSAWEQFEALNNERPNDPALEQMKRDLEDMINSRPPWFGATK